MALFDFFKKKTKAPAETSSDEKLAFVIEWDNRISEKCEYGDNIAALSKEERLFFVAQELEREVNNGGFSQFFYNSSGDLSMELIEAFTEIGALSAARICQKALSVFPGSVPADCEQRRALLEEAGEGADALLNECDDEFLEYPEDLTALYYAFLMKNRKRFS